MTGVTKFSKVSVFSKRNNLCDITMSEPSGNPKLFDVPNMSILPLLLQTVYLTIEI
jgi:hypothetical protein